MMDENDNLPDVITDSISNLPAPVETTALKAFSRLLGGAGAWMAAWMRRPVQSVEDQTDARSLIMRRIAETAAERASENEALVDAALITMLPKHLRQHANKEAVVEAAAEELAREASTEPEGKTERPRRGQEGNFEVDEDWLNMFERFAEDASSEKLQKLWGRVLAGEIRQEGSYSKRTLRFVSELDRDMAKNCEFLAQYLIGDVFVKGASDEKNSFIPGVEAQQVGLAEGFGGLGLVKTITLNDTGKVIFPGRSLGILIEGAPNTHIELDLIAVLTSTGREIFSLLDIGDETERLRNAADKIPKDNVSSLRLFRYSREGGGVKYWELETLWEKPLA